MRDLSGSGRADVDVGRRRANRHLGGHALQLLLCRQHGDMMVAAERRRRASDSRAGATGERGCDGPHGVLRAREGPLGGRSRNRGRATVRTAGCMRDVARARDTTALPRQWR
jgi:hypothetical protein